MTSQEFKDKFLEIEKAYETDILKLSKKYAFANSNVGVGDLLSDSSCIIKVDTIKFTRGSAEVLPRCVYYGPVLKKDLTPRKDNSRPVIYQKYK